MNKDTTVKLIEQEYQTKKYKLYCRVSDKEFKETIILVHGLGISSIYLTPVAEKLASRYNVYLPDLPGFGNSEKPLKVLSIKDLAEVLIDFADTLKVQTPIFLGNSFGCQVIAELASSFPDRVKALILVGPTVNPKERTLLKQAKAFAADSKLEPDWQQGAANKDYKKAGVIRLASTAWIAMNDEIEKKLPQIQAPSLIIRGSQDPFVSADWARDAADLLPKSSLKEIPGKGHTLNSNAPEALAKEVDNFLKAKT